MSRSYKKVPCVKDKNPGMKKYANRKVRRRLDIKNNSYYKRVVCQYDICDYKFKYEFNKYCEKSNEFNRELGKDEQSKEELYKEWYKIYKRK